MQVSIALDVNKSYTVIKETERPKHLPTRIVEMMKGDGYPRFTITSHMKLWKMMDAKERAKGFGVPVEKTWYWYDSWIEQVRKHCQENATKYR